MGNCKEFDPTGISNYYSNKVRDVISGLKKKPAIVAFFANPDEGKIRIAESIKRACLKTGISFELSQVSKYDLEEEVLKANEDEAITGIIINYPVFGNRQDEYLKNVILPEKDVEGLCHRTRYNIFHNIRTTSNGHKPILPCTPLAIMKTLKHLGAYDKRLEKGNRLYGKAIVVINRSERVGRPLAALLANDGACVHSVDISDIQAMSRGPGLKFPKFKLISARMSFEECLNNADIIISGVPSKSYKIHQKLIKEGAICINFSSDENFDASIKLRASVFVKSLGELERVMLMRNSLRSAIQQSNFPPLTHSK
ncbi:uncharacterized protein LOC135120569 [Zophobas morio]|uniref:uncharacterized protein LOC135120569 n=1 Tax=Zophobas morio TaxID=2755281 RepID=UPI00308304AB